MPDASGEPVRVAMWSGPRNISTALMRAFENRPDAVVRDEPLYAHYLRETGADHPGREEVVATHEAEWEAVAASLTGPVERPDGAPVRVFYQKHMAHHLLPHVGRGWLFGLRHAFLIRDPREMLLSLDRVTPSPGLADTGLPQQAELFEAERARTGATPPVVDARDVLQDPEGLLRRLCAALGIEFLPQMLSWPPGPRATDGVWARHWYGAVWESTGFAPWAPREGELGPALRRVHAEAQGLYERLYEERLTA